MWSFSCGRPTPSENPTPRNLARLFEAHACGFLPVTGQRRVRARLLEERLSDNDWIVGFESSDAFESFIVQSPAASQVRRDRPAASNSMGIFQNKCPNAHF